jgi:hypothetical protein
MKKCGGHAPLELHDGNDRLCSMVPGAPVLDCEGRVAAVVSTPITQTDQPAVGPVRVSTACKTLNVAPSGVFEGLSGGSAEALGCHQRSSERASSTLQQTRRIE